MQKKSNEARYIIYRSKLRNNEKNLIEEIVKYFEES